MNLTDWVGAALAAWSGVPDRSVEASALSEELRSLPGVARVDGRYNREPTMGYSYNVDVTLTDDATGENALDVAGWYYSSFTREFARHTSRFVVRQGAHVLRVFSDDRHRTSPITETERWLRLTHELPGAVDWAAHSDTTRGSGSIELVLDRPARTGDPALLAALPELLARHADDLADRHWIIRWRRLRLDLLGSRYPVSEVFSLISRLATDGQWSASYDPSTDPALKLAVWAETPDLMEATARAHLALIRTLGFLVSYTVRANLTSPVEVVVGGHLTGGNELQQRLNREFGAGCELH